MFRSFLSWPDTMAIQKLALTQNLFCNIGSNRESNAVICTNLIKQLTSLKAILLVFDDRGDEDEVRKARDLCFEPFTPNSPGDIYATRCLRFARRGVNTYIDAFKDFCVTNGKMV